jgi:hypothetical protein
VSPYSFVALRFCVGAQPGYNEVMYGVARENFFYNFMKNILPLVIFTFSATKFEDGVREH